MRINRRGDRWNMELRKQNASNSDVNAFVVGASSTSTKMISNDSAVCF